MYNMQSEDGKRMSYPAHLSAGDAGAAMASPKKGKARTSSVSTNSKRKRARAWLPRRVSIRRPNSQTKERKEGDAPVVESSSMPPEAAKAAPTHPQPHRLQVVTTMASLDHWLSLEVGQTASGESTPRGITRKWAASPATKPTSAACASPKKRAHRLQLADDLCGTHRNAHFGEVVPGGSMCVGVAVLMIGLLAVMLGTALAAIGLAASIGTHFLDRPWLPVLASCTSSADVTGCEEQFMSLGCATEWFVITSSGVNFTDRNGFSETVLFGDLGRPPSPVFTNSSGTFTTEAPALSGTRENMKSIFILTLSGTAVAVALMAAQLLGLCTTSINQSRVGIRGSLPLVFWDSICGLLYSTVALGMFVAAQQLYVKMSPYDTIQWLANYTDDCILLRAEWLKTLLPVSVKLCVATTIVLWGRATLCSLIKPDTATTRCEPSYPGRKEIA